ncbi:hypothetical protein JNJ66_00180 [Candidatus Saccharibacteria bacterium]|nr:hypothetical protein [Candidatus Saccharibacteria bacterium]
MSKKIIKKSSLSYRKKLILALILMPIGIILIHQVYLFTLRAADIQKLEHLSQFVTQLARELEEVKQKDRFTITNDCTSLARVLELIPARELCTTTAEAQEKIYTYEDVKRTIDITQAALGKSRIVAEVGLASDNLYPTENVSLVEVAASVADRQDDAGNAVFKAASDDVSNCAVEYDIDYSNGQNEPENQLVLKTIIYCSTETNGSYNFSTW